MAEAYVVAKCLKIVFFVHFTRGKRKKQPTVSSDEDDAASSPPKKRMKKKTNRQRILTAGSSSSELDDDVQILSQHKAAENGRKVEKVEPRPEKIITSPVLSKPEVEISTGSRPPAPDRNSAESSLLNSSICSTSSTADQSVRRTVLVSASEVHRAVELISDLKHRFNVDVVVRSGLSVSFLLSPRLGVHRMSVKDFCNGAHRAALVDQCQKMNDLVRKDFICYVLINPPLSSGYWAFFI